MKRIQMHHRRGMTRLIALARLVLVGVVVAVLVSATAVWAEWSDPANVSPAGKNADSHQAAIDADGDAVIVWRRSDGSNYRVEAGSRSAAGAPGATRTLSGPGYNAGQPRAAMDSAGNALAVWSRFDGTNHRVEARSLAASGTLGPIQTLVDSETAASAPQVAMNATGDAVVVWSRFVGSYSSVQIRGRSASGALTATQTLSAAGQSADSAQVAIDPQGNAVVVWRRFDGVNHRIQMRVRSASGELSATRTLSAAGQSADSPQVAVDPDGNAVAVWRRFNGAIYRVQVRARSNTGELSAIQTVSKQGHNVGVVPQVGVDADGNAVVAWYAYDGTSVRVQTRARTAQGVLSSTRYMSDTGTTNVGPPQVVVDSAGNAVVAWHLWDGANLRVQVRARSAGGALSPVENLSSKGVNAVYPDLAGNAAGNVVAAWNRSGSPYTRIQVTGGP